MLQQNVLRFQVTVNDAVITLKFESLEDLDGESPNQTWVKTLKLVLFYKLIEVHGQQFK